MHAKSSKGIMWVVLAIWYKEVQVKVTTCLTLCWTKIFTPTPPSSGDRTRGESANIFIFTPQNTAPLKQMLAENKPPTSHFILTKFKLKNLASLATTNTILHLQHPSSTLFPPFSSSKQPTPLPSSKKCEVELEDMLLEVTKWFSLCFSYFWRTKACCLVRILMLNSFLPKKRFWEELWRSEVLEYP